MRRRLWALGILMVSQLAWGAPQELQFISTLSSPVGSFREIEAKDCYVQVKFPRNEGTGEVNIGSSSALGGTVRIQGQPFEVGTLWLENNTTFRMSSGVKWIVNEVRIGNFGSVEPTSLHAQNIVNDSAKDANLSARKVIVDGNVTTTSAVVGSTLAITSLLFSGSQSSATATFHQLAKTAKETSAGVTPSTTWVIATGS